MKKFDIYLWIAGQILITGAAMMLISFLPEYLRDFFGDYHCNGNTYNEVTKVNTIGCTLYEHPHAPEWHWGYRHFIWVAMGVVYFILNVIRIVDKIDKRLKES